ncbi:hypothetical protein SHKM778_16510 [Streptomyces sp. KM77-8]|uniref:DUF397 domain-containing protein n=1 Tax=Streptomyces haneummycinicus TaxID=3074435 RepID=A0AAT9HD13_9ACTN
MTRSPFMHHHPMSMGTAGCSGGKKPDASVPRGGAGGQSGEALSRTRGKHPGVPAPDSPWNKVVPGPGRGGHEFDLFVGHLRAGLSGRGGWCRPRWRSRAGECGGPLLVWR